MVLYRHFLTCVCFYLCLQEKRKNGIFQRRPLGQSAGNSDAEKCVQVIQDMEKTVAKGAARSSFDSFKRGIVSVVCWWTQKKLIWLVVWNMNFIFPYIWNVIIPTDFPIFQRGGLTTNQRVKGFVNPVPPKRVVQKGFHRHWGRVFLAGQCSCCRRIPGYSMVFLWIHMDRIWILHGFTCRDNTMKSMEVKHVLMMAPEVRCVLEWFTMI